MQKIIIKTAIITLCAVIIIGALTFLSIHAFAPVNMGNFYSEIGREEKAFEYYERAYEKQKNQENFVKLVNSAIVLQDNQKLIEYFAEYEAQKYQLDEGYLMFLAGKYCVAQVKMGKSDLAMTTAITYANGYKNQNPVQYLIAYGLEQENKTFLGELLARLTAYKVTNYKNIVEEDRIRLDKDLTNLTLYCVTN